MSAKEVLMAAAGGGLTPTFISSSVGIVQGPETVTVTAPSGIQNGDLLVAIGLHSSDATVNSAPSGFVAQIFSPSGASTLSLFVQTKVASSESGNYSWTWNTSGDSSVSILVYRNASTINTVGNIARVTSASATATSITPTYAGTLIGVFGIDAKSASISTNPSGMTQRATAGIGIGTFEPKAAVYDLSPQDAVATGTKTLVWSTSSSINIALLFQITNEPDVAPNFIASASTQNSSTGTTLVINKPTGTIDGDLMVAICASNNPVTWTGATGWTEVADLGTTPSLRIAYKVAATEGASYTFTASASLLLSGSILTYRYAAYDTIGAFTSATDPLILPSISPSESQSILLATGARASILITLGTPTNMTARVTDNDSTSPSYIVCDQTVAKGPTGTRSMSTGSITNVAGIMLSIKPTRSL